jgi:hypothetical protein
LRVARLTACALLAVILAGGSAHGYVRYRTSTGAATHWARGCVPLTVHLDGVPDMTAEDVRAAVTAAAGAWTTSLACSGASLPLTFAAGEGPVPADDGTNVIGARRDGWCQEGMPVPPGGCNSPSALAVTSVFSVRQSGLVIGADIELNTINFSWGRFESNPTRQDLQAALTHELGHLLGFDHPCSTGSGLRATDDKGAPVPDCHDAPPDLQSSVLFPARAPSDPPQRALSAEDQRGVCEVYPADKAPATCPLAEEGGCSCGVQGGRGRLSLLMIVVFAAAWRRRRTGNRVQATGNRQRAIRAPAEV